MGPIAGHKLLRHMELRPFSYVRVPQMIGSGIFKWHMTLCQGMILISHMCCLVATIVLDHISCQMLILRLSCESCGNSFQAECLSPFNH